MKNSKIVLTTDVLRRASRLLLRGMGMALAVLLVGSLAVTPAMADPPGMPHQFYGTVTVDGSAPSDGTTVAAYVNGVAAESTTTTSGKYGYSPLFKVTGSGGQTVTFTVDGDQAAQSATYQAGGVTRLNLTVTTGVLNITTTSLPNGTLAVAYSQTLEATNGTLPYTWSHYSGSLPAGLSLSSAGVISGTPTAAGTFSFTVKVQDAVSATDTQPLSITITDPGGVLTITTTTLPNGTLGSAYSQTVTAIGGTTPHSWSITSGSLPAGFSLAVSTGIISGTPTANGTSSFTVQVQDAVLATDTQALSIAIGEGGGTGEALIGTDSEGGLSFHPTCASATKFAAAGSGTVTEIRVYPIANGNVKVAIYSDDSGAPGNLLGSSGSTAVTTGDWRSVSLDSSVAVTEGTYYWLAVRISVSGASSMIMRSGTSKWTSLNYSSGWPDPAGSWTDWPSYWAPSMCLAGYGSGGGGGPGAPDAPIRLTPAINSVTFSWNAVSGATKYHLQVSTSSGFGTTVEDDNNISVTFKQVTGLSGGTYYWRVKAYTTEWSGWSSIGSVIGQ